MGIDNTYNYRTFFENGIYESVLEEILTSQKKFPNKVFYLQPYSNKLIIGFKKNPPSEDKKWTFYASTTIDLAHVHYTAKVVGWRNKKELSAQEIDELNEHIHRYQPNENFIDIGKGVNLITLVNLQKLAVPISVNRFYKTKDGTALRPRTQAGGWSYVFPYNIQEEKEYILKSIFENELQNKVNVSLNKNSETRKERLESAPIHPEKIAIVTTGFKRNPDVIAEALIRANGICGLCKRDAPFQKAKDGSPYLEVHHWTPLAEGGEDTIENAVALCPNCHKEAHFGSNKDHIKNYHHI